MSEGELGHVFGCACASVGDSYLLCRWSQNGKACSASIFLADVVSVGSRVVSYHDGVCGEADMLVLVNLFNRAVECRSQTVGSIGSTLGKTNACCATLGVGSVDSHTFLVGFVGFGQAGLFVLCEGDAVV